MDLSERVDCAPGVCVFGRQCVQGTGDPSARVLLLGDAPDREQLKYGRPMVGRVGQMLNRLLEYADLPRDTLWITNVCGCVELKRDDKRPLPSELLACRPRVLREIEMVDAPVVVLMGNIAMSHWFPGFRVGQIYNTCRRVGNRTYIATYHPSAAIHNGQLEEVIVEGLSLARRLSRE